MNIFDKSIYAKQAFVDSALFTKLSITGNALTASTATKLTIARNINNVAFDGSGDITITADAGTLTGATLNSTVINSSLTSVGTLTNTIINGKLVVGSSSPVSASAVLEANSTTQGFLPPRMTTTQRDAILSPATGLVIFNTITDCLEFKTSTVWVSLTTSNSANYSSILIGTQNWMDKNLNVSTYQNGDIIQYVSDPAAWAALTTGAWCYYNNDPANNAIYGKLYNWYAVNDPRGLAPKGWHIPTDAEWTTLSTTLGGDAVAGWKMKTIGTTIWNSDNTGATNESGFSALPSGRRYLAGTAGYIFGFLGSQINFWSATSIYPTIAGISFLTSGAGNLVRSDAPKKYGYSVRCVRD
jgi:uncharacterized protein (TIGR02145 family)